MQCFSYQLIGRFFLIESEYFIKFRPNFCLVQKYPGAQILCAEAIFQVFLYSKREYLSTQATGDVVLDPFLSALRQPHRANHFLASNSFVSISQAIFSQSQNFGKIIYRTHTSLRQENIFHILPPELRQEMWSQTIFIFVDSPFH